MIRHRAVVLMFVALAITACEERKPLVVEQTVPPVLVRAVTLENLAQERRLSGTVKPRVESDLGFRVAGKVTRRLVDAGQTVAAGQVLAELDHDDFALQLRQAQAELTAAQTARNMTAAEFDRVSTLRAAGWSTASDHDRQRAAADEATSRATRAEHAVTLARNSVEYATLRADASGVITSVLAEPGQVLSIGQPVFRLAHLDRLEVEVAVPETLMPLVRVADARVTLWALPGQSFPARLRELSPRADAATRTYPARFALPENSDGVSWGMTATVSLREPALSTAAGQGALLPLTAFLDQGSGPTVFVVDPKTNILTQRPVRMARVGTEQGVVMEGLTEGDQVVLLGVQKLIQGQRVRPVTRLPS